MPTLRQFTLPARDPKHSPLLRVELAHEAGFPGEILPRGLLVAVVAAMGEEQEIDAVRIGREVGRGGDRQAGGAPGALPAREIASWGVRVAPASRSAQELAAELRTGDPNDDCTPDDQPDPTGKRRPRRLLLETDLLTGDIDRESVEPVAQALTPVPGGVGPMTVAMLLVNTYRAYRQHLGQA